MGANFRDLKQVLRSEIHDRYDHRHLNDIAPFDSVPPTAENLAREVFRILSDGVLPSHEQMQGAPTTAYPAERMPRRRNAADARLVRVEVWEGPEACACYEE